MTASRVFASVLAVFVACVADGSDAFVESAPGGAGAPEEEPQADPVVAAAPHGIAVQRLIHGGSLKGERVHSFFLDATESTVEVFRACVAAGRCEAPPRLDFCLYWQEEKETHPMNCVSRAQAAAYCDWIGRRLPTAREWEWAAQGGSEKRPAPWGDAPITCEHANVDLGLKRDGTRPCHALTLVEVGSASLGASRDGVLDLVGNVKEWVADGEDWEARIMGVSALEPFSSDDLRPDFSMVADGTASNYQEVGFRCAAATP